MSGNFNNFEKENFHIAENLFKKWMQNFGSEQQLLTSDIGPHEDDIKRLYTYFHPKRDTTFNVFPGLQRRSGGSSRARPSVGQVAIRASDAGRGQLSLPRSAQSAKTNLETGGAASDVGAGMVAHPSPSDNVVPQLSFFQGFLLESSSTSCSSRRSRRSASFVFPRDPRR